MPPTCGPDATSCSGKYNTYIVPLLPSALVVMFAWFYSMRDAILAMCVRASAKGYADSGEHDISWGRAYNCELQISGFNFNSERQRFALKTHVSISCCIQRPFWWSVVQLVVKNDLIRISGWSSGSAKPAQTVHAFDKPPAT